MIAGFLQAVRSSRLRFLDAIDVLRHDALQEADARCWEWRVLAEKSADELATARAQLSEAHEAVAELSAELHRARGKAVSFRPEIKSPRQARAEPADADGKDPR